MELPATIVRQEPLPGQHEPWPVQVDPARATPVFGTATPSRGVPLLLRRFAYRYPAYDAERWLSLLVADRIAAAGEISGEAVTPGQQGLVIRHFARLVRAHPAGFAAIAGLIALGGFGAARLLGQGRR